MNSWPLWGKGALRRTYLILAFIIYMLLYFFKSIRADIKLPYFLNALLLIFNCYATNFHLFLIYSCRKLPRIDSCCRIHLIYSCCRLPLICNCCRLSLMCYCCRLSLMCYYCRLSLTFFCCRLPLTQCKQNFMSMDASLRSEVKGLMTEHCEKFNLDPNLLFIPTFVASTGYKTRISAVDAVLACGTMLEDVVGLSLTVSCCHC